MHASLKLQKEAILPNTGGWKIRCGEFVVDSGRCNAPQVHSDPLFGASWRGLLLLLLLLLDRRGLGCTPLNTMMIIMTR